MSKVFLEKCLFCIFLHFDMTVSTKVWRVSYDIKEFESFRLLSFENKICCFLFHQIAYFLLQVFS